VLTENRTLVKKTPPEGGVSLFSTTTDYSCTIDMDP
jgi:hypothetical protein